MHDYGRFVDEFDIESSSGLIQAFKSNYDNGNYSSLRKMLKITREESMTEDLVDGLMQDDYVDLVVWIAKQD